jgi:hypothetical protein
MPAVTVDEYKDFDQCIKDGVKDSYDPTADRDAVFGEGWRELDALQTQGMPVPADTADTLDTRRVRVPSFTLTQDQADKLYMLLSHDGFKGLSGGSIADADVGKDLAMIMSLI